MSDSNVAKPNGVSKLVFGNFESRMFLATSVDVFSRRTFEMVVTNMVSADTGAPTMVLAHVHK